MFEYNRTKVADSMATARREKKKKKVQYQVKEYHSSLLPQVGQGYGDIKVA